MFHVYVLKSQSTGKIYIGQTANLDKRLKRHNLMLPTKSSGYTYKNKGPWKLVYKEVMPTRKAAMIREKALKEHQGRQFIKRLIMGP